MMMARCGGAVADTVMVRGVRGGDGGEAALSGLLRLLLLLLMAHVDGGQGLLHGPSVPQGSPMLGLQGLCMVVHGVGHGQLVQVGLQILTTVQLLLLLLLRVGAHLHRSHTPHPRPAFSLTCLLRIRRCQPCLESYHAA